MQDVSCEPLMLWLSENLTSKLGYFQTGSGSHRPFLSLLLLCFFDETSLFVLLDRLSGLFRSDGL